MKLTEMIVGKTKIDVEGQQCNYSGELTQNRANGEGQAILVRDDSISFKGTFRENKLHGISKFSNSLLTFI